MAARTRPRRPLAPGSAEACTLRIERLAAGGDAIAVRDDGKTVFVEDGVPGDLVRARIVHERKRFARARIEEVLEPSADRVAPRCAHFGRCGGCAWQHVRYEAQVEAKARILRDAFERIGGFALDSDPPMTASPCAYGYRGRARVHVAEGRVGFLERGSHRLCAIDACPVLAPALEEAVLALRREQAGREVDAAPIANAKPRAMVEWSACIGTTGGVSIARVGGGGVTGDAPAPVFLEVGGARVGLDARAFSQANRELHGALVERVLAVLLEGPGDARSWNVLEVHAGVGFFTCAVAGRVQSIVAVESDPHACDWLTRNVASARVEVIQRSFEAASARLAERRFDAVLVDPPRTGLAPPELTSLVTLAPPRIVYLSCDPATLARDARGLAEAGYRLDRVEGFDLFPQTPHVEGLARLVRT